MKRKTKGWSTERRRKQAQNCKETKPWKHTTGPKTEDGKAVIARNALKHGLYSADIYHLKQLLRQQAAFLRTLKGAQRLVDKTADWPRSCKSTLAPPSKTLLD